jgi:glyoxylase-like metal-dependent hydrolase (beta-lactamase superfamily II)
VPDRVPILDALPLGAPASRDPLPPETSVDRLGEGIVLCEIPTPYMMGSTNCWLAIGDDDVLCVDPGTDAGVAAQRIGAALAPYGRTIESIETILVTHTHPDHCGAAAGLAAIADARVAVGAPELDRMTGRPDPPSAVASAWLALGAPPGEVQRAARSLPIHTPVVSDRVRPLHDGTTLRAGGRRWDVHLVAGHSPGHVVLVGDGMLLAGDQLLANVIPAIHFGPAPLRRNDRGARDRDGLPWAPSVADFLASMDRFDEGFDAMTVLPGHGSAFRGTARPIARARRYHRIRCELVAARLETRGPTSVWDLTLEMYAGLVSAAGIDHRFGSAAAEIAGRLEALVAADRATLTQPDGAVVFAPA